ncbi:DUF3418 domain-containing protein [Stutzerimonas stutzeri]|uniref:DUF3418 domain-containing protein n=1 Tax=Stutzerimonas stutzeri TaxID=316 RepID=UPI003EE2ABEA
MGRGRRPRLENHLKMNIEVVDARGKFLGEGAVTCTDRRGQPGSRPAEGRAEPVEAKGFAQGQQKRLRQRWPRLVDDESIRLWVEGWVVEEGRFPTQAEADWQHRRALQRLLLQQLAEPAKKYLRNSCRVLPSSACSTLGMGKVDALVEDILLASLDSCVSMARPRPRDGAALASLAERKRGDPHAERLARLTLEILKH